MAPVPPGGSPRRRIALVSTLTFVGGLFLGALGGSAAGPTAERDHFDTSCTLLGRGDKADWLTDALRLERDLSGRYRFGSDLRADGQGRVITAWMEMPKNSRCLITSREGGDVAASYRDIKAWAVNPVEEPEAVIDADASAKATPSNPVRHQPSEPRTNAGETQP